MPTRDGIKDGSGGGSGSLPPFISVDGAALIEHPLGVASWGTIDMIAASFSAAVGLALGAAIEVGDTFTDPAFNCSYNRPPSGPCSIGDGAGGSVALVSPFTAGTLVKAYTKIVPNQTQAWTLTANGPPSKNASCSKQWQPRRYFGVAVPGAYTEAFIKAIPSSDLGASRVKNPIAFNAGATQKCYYAYPTSYAGIADNFIDAGTGWPAGFSKVATGVVVTNTFGVAINYDVWESDQLNLGVWNMLVN